MDATEATRSSEPAVEIVTCLRRALPKLCGDHGVSLAYLYGSSLTGLSHPWSDVDLALVVDPDLSLQEQLKLIMRLDAELTDACGINNADIRVVNAAPIVLKGKVVTEGMLIYARNEETRVDFETSTRLRYFDYLPVHREFHETSLNVLRERGLHG